MANASAAEVVDISEIEHNLAELSNANLHTAKTFFNSNGFVAWRSLWLRDERDVERETSNALRSLPAENHFTYVKARSLLPRDIVYNKVRRVLESVSFTISLTSDQFLTTFLEAQFPTAQLLQIYARQATTAGAIFLQSTNAIAPVLVQIIVPHQEVPLSIKIESGGRHMHLTGNGLA
jgi:hypothetical protein